MARKYQNCYLDFFGNIREEKKDKGRAGEK